MFSDQRLKTAAVSAWGVFLVGVTCVGFFPDLWLAILDVGMVGFAAVLSVGTMLRRQAAQTRLAVWGARQEPGREQDKVMQLVR